MNFFAVTIKKFRTHEAIRSSYFVPNDHFTQSFFQYIPFSCFFTLYQTNTANVIYTVSVIYHLVILFSSGPQMLNLDSLLHQMAFSKNSTTQPHVRSRVGSTGVGAIVPPKTNKSYFIYHDFVQLEKQHIRPFAVHCFATAML